MVRKNKLMACDCIDTPAYHRNCIHIVEVLKSELKSDNGDILEIASGSGQHALAFARAFPNYIFWPSDISADYLNSIEAWRKNKPLENLKAPFKLDVLARSWNMGEINRPPGVFDAIININMVHISPIQAAEGLFRGSSKYMGEDGKLFLYGPFKINGEHTAQSNREFDEILRARNSTWGLRDLEELSDLALTFKLVLQRRVSMPSNNFVLIFCRNG